MFAALLVPVDRILKKKNMYSPVHPFRFPSRLRDAGTSEKEPVKKAKNICYYYYFFLTTIKMNLK